jgi:hypothetical protein
MENARKLDVRVVLGALAVAFAAAALWAATAFVGGPSSGTTDPATSPSPAAAFVQDDGRAEPDDSAPLPDDCPERGDGGEGEDSGASDTSGSDL